MDTSAFLYPVSEAARQSFSLPENDEIMGRPLDPLTPRSIDDLPGVVDVVGKASSTTYAILERGEACYTLGSDISNSIILRDSSSNVCWINYRHCHLYPDPDFEDWWIQNASASTYIIRAPNTTTEYDIVAGATLPLHSGTWLISLGKGLEVLLYMKASADSTHSEHREHQSIIAKLRKLTSPKTTTKASSSKSKSSKLDASRPIPTLPLKAECDTAPSIAALSQIISPAPAQALSTKLRPAKAELSNPTASTSLESSIVLGKTRYSEVRRILRSGVVRAEKRCRDSSIPTAVHVWRNEVDVLRGAGYHMSMTHTARIVADPVPAQYFSVYSCGSETALYYFKSRFWATSGSLHRQGGPNFYSI